MQCSPSQHLGNRSDQRPLSVLLVETSLEGACSFSEQLSQSSIQATLHHAEGWDEGLAALREEEPNVLVLHPEGLQSEIADPVQAAAQVAPQLPIVVLTNQDAPGPCGGQETERVEHLRADELTPPLLGRTLEWAVQQNRMQQKLQQRDAWIRSMKEITEAGVFRAKANGRIEYADEALVRMLGFERCEQVVGLDLTTLFADPTRNGRMDAAMEESHTEVLLQRPDGSAFVGRLSAEATRGGNGEIRHYDGTIVDITQHKDREERFRLLSRAVEHADESVLITEGAPLDGPGPRIQYVNEAFEEMTGYTKEEVLGKTPRILQGPKTDRAVLDSLREALEAEENWSGKTVNYRKDGTPYFVEWTLSPVVENGSVEYWVSLQRDVTDQREQAERLRRQRNLLEQAQRLAGAWEVDLRTGEKAWSDVVYQILEVDPDTDIDLEESLGFFVGEAESKLRQALRRCAEEGASYDLEVPIRTAQGNRRWIRTVGAPSEMEDGEVVKVAGAIQNITERKQAEKALKEREIQLRGLTNSIPGVVFQAYARPGREYGFYHVSDHAEDLLGIARDPATFFERCLDRVPDDERDDLVETIDEAVDAEAALEFEVPFIRPSGETIWILGTATPEVRDNEIVYNGVILDITERKEAEQELERATYLLRHAGDMAKLGGWSVDVSGEPPYDVNWTDGLYDLFELPRDTEPPTEDVFEYYHPDDRDRHVEAVEHAMENGGGWDHTLRLIGAEGTERWVRNIGRTIMEDGEVVEVRGAIQEITDQIETEEELRWTKTYYEQILSQVPIDLAVFTPDAEFEYLNPKSVSDPEMREWLRGRTNEEYCRHRGLDPELGRKRDEVIRETARENKAIHFEETIDTGDGPRHFLRVHGPVSNLDGEITNVVAFGLDITDRKNKEHRLREAKDEAERMNRLKSAFLANISHEIRTPLTSILGFAEAIGDEVGDKEEADEIDFETLARFSDLIQQSGQRLMETLTSVLNLSRLEAGEMELSPTPINLASEARDAVVEFGPQAQEAGVELEADVETSSVWARADAGGLQIVLRNLLSNAIKYTEEGGQVEVRVHSGPDGALLEVEDTGIGMDPDTTSQLFEAFKQASEGIGREYEGTGLGLTVTKEALDRMNGSIEVDTAKGEGSCFTVWLPRPETKAVEAPSSADA